MKKFLIIIALCFIPLSVLLTGCGHKHSVAEGDVWYHSATQHWQTCSGDDCDKKLGLSEHNFVDILDKDTDSTCTVNGKDYKKCIVCNYETYTEKPLRGHFFVDGICSCGEEESTFASELEWNNLFIGDNLNNVTLEQNMYLYSKTPENGANPLIKSETTRYSLCSEDATMIRTSSQNVKSTVYHIKQNGNWYGLSMINNQWYGMIETETEAKAGSFQNQIGLDFINKYNSFSYDSVNKRFMANNIVINGETTEYVKIFIENGKLIKIEYKTNMVSEYVISTIEFTNHGTTVVDVPQFTIAG